jgi:ATP/maltotriose-dependent transcriptional regulator MalT/DNA-binding SARP family transcriptional activator
VTARRSTVLRPEPDSHPLLKAKLSRPNVGEHVLERPRLLQALHENAQRPLTLVVAEAGYGKTTLLASFARALRRPVVWYSLMPSDADLVVFGRYLLAGFRRESPRFGRDFHRALEEARPDGRSAEMLGGTLANQMATLKGPPHLLVLDDFQEVARSAHVVTLVDTFLRHLPPAVRVVVASRSLPPLAHERMRAKGELFELNSSHLRLTREELSRLFAEIYRRPLTDEDLTALEETTLGWPTAVHLVHESLRRTSLTLEEVLNDFRTSNLELHDYLSTEVFTRLDEDSRRLLERTAALSRFDADLASRLAGVRNARPALESLARRGLLRTFGSGPQATYECHELVRRFLRQDCETRAGAEGWRALEGETAAALAQRGEPERALRHYLLAGRADDAAQLVRQLAPALLRQGRAAALVQYLGDLPEDLVRADPTLAVPLADARQALGQWDQAEALYELALERCRQTGAREAECRGLLGLSKLMQNRGKQEQVLGMVERGLAMGDMGVDVRAGLLQRKAGAHFYLGQFQAAVQVLGQVSELLGPGDDPELLVQNTHNLAIAYGAQGRFREASDEFRAALAHVRGTSSPRAPLYLSNLAFLYIELGELAEARRAAEEGLAAAQRFANRAQEALCHQALAQALTETGDLDGALGALKHADEINAELRMEVIAADLLRLRARIFCARGQYRRAVEFLNLAIERLASRPDDPHVTEFKATLAWCELRAGRPRVARDLLAPLIVKADAGESDFHRMRSHYWLAEAMLALGEKRGVDHHLELALRLVRSRGYMHFLKVQAREEPAPLLHALARGMEIEPASMALVEAGSRVEEPLLDLLEHASTSVGEAALAVVSEIASAGSLARLESLARSRRALAPAIRTALRHVAERTTRGARVEAEVQVRLLLFGPPQLQVNGQPVSASVWRAQRAFHLLIYLALHPRGTSRDVLLEMFWPGRQMAAGRRNFHPTLSYIRSVLPDTGEPPILRTAEFYRLNPEYPLSCDAWELDRTLEDARRGASARERRGALERAAALAGGPFLEGLYGDWADELQARTRDRVERLLLDLGGLCARAGDFDAAVGHYRRAAELDEFREATRLSVMECLIRIGNRRAALAEYDKLKALLRSELQVEPLPETDEAVRRLLAGESVHGWPMPQPQSDGPHELEALSQAPLKRRLRSSAL